MFWKFFSQKHLLCDIGNFYCRSSLFEKKFNRSKILSQISLNHTSYKNGVIRNHELFINTMKESIAKHQEIDSLIIAINPTYAQYHLFKNTKETQLQQIKENMSQNHILHSEYKEKKIFSISVEKVFLNKIYSRLETVSSKPIRFIILDYIKSLSIKDSFKLTNCIVLYLGYKYSTIAIFDKNFLVYYKTLPVGAESLVVAIASKYNISVIDSIDFLKQIDLRHKDLRSWIKCGDTSMNSSIAHEEVMFYSEAIIGKLLIHIKREFLSHDLVLTGWGSIVKGMDLVFRKYFESVNVHEELNQLAGHLRLINYL